MNLFIETENGVTKNHPAFEDNLIQAFGSVPEHWETFIRVERPVPTLYQLLESEEPTYAKVDGFWTDIWALRNMTAEEIISKQQAVKDKWAAKPQAENWSTWVFDEATCTMVPPIPRPDPVEGKPVFWCGAENNWKEAPVRPEGQYKFNFILWNWIAI